MDQKFWELKFRLMGLLMLLKGQEEKLLIVPLMRGVMIARLIRRNHPLHPQTVQKEDIEDKTNENLTVQGIKNHPLHHPLQTVPKEEETLIINQLNKTTLTILQVFSITTPEHRVIIQIPSIIIVT